MNDYTMYDYQPSRDYAEQVELVFMEEWVPEIDRTFDEMGLSQDEVNQLMREYIWRIKHLFTPSNYTFKQRVLIALFFLRGK